MHFFWKTNREKLGLRRLPKLDLRTTYSYLNVLFEIQRLHYVPPWRALIGELTEIASQKINAKIFKSRKFEILHWMLTLMFIRSWIENDKEKLTDKIVVDQIHPKYVMASLEEVVAALHELSDRKGSRILNVEQNAKGIPIYFFNTEAYLIPLENYLRATMKYRALWQEKLATLA